jgi:hypothetical protein
VGDLNYLTASQKEAFRSIVDIFSVPFLFLQQRQVSDVCLLET